MIFENNTMHIATLLQIFLCIIYKTWKDLKENKEDEVTVDTPSRRRVHRIYIHEGSRWLGKQIGSFGRYCL